MIQQIVITDYLCQAANQPIQLLEALLAACPALARARFQVNPSPASIACLSRLTHDDAATHSTAIASLLAKRYQPAVPASYCLLPVQLHVQRDTFSLQGNVALSPAHYQSLTTLLTSHFAADFALHPDHSQQYWWVRPRQSLQAHGRWPQHCLYQAAFEWQPQGEHGGLLRQWSNEMQMLLHQAQHAPTAVALPEALNGLWFASVGDGIAFQHGFTHIAGRGEVFAGLCAAGLTLGQAQNAVQAPLPQTLVQRPLSFSSDTPTAGVKAQHLWIADTQDQIDWSSLQAALSAKQIHQLNIVLPFAERHLEIQLQTPRWWQRWQSPPTPDTILQKLHAALTAPT